MSKLYKRFPFWFPFALAAGWFTVAILNPRNGVGLSYYLQLFLAFFYLVLALTCDGPRFLFGVLWRSLKGEV